MLSAYSHFREVIPQEGLPTKQDGSERWRGGLALLLICDFHFSLPVTFAFHDLCCVVVMTLEVLLLILA